MILVDINLLVYATNRASPEHEPAREWLSEQMSGSERIGLPWHTIFGFIRLATSARIFRTPLRMTDALQQIRDWLALEIAWIPAPTEQHAAVLGKLLSEPGIGSNHVPDAHLAALAIEHGLTLCSTDGDFARWRQLNWINPIAA